MTITVTVVSVSMPAVAETCRYAESMKKMFSEIEFRIHYIGEDEAMADLMTDIECTDVLLTDLMGADGNIFSAVVSSMKKCRGQRLTVGGMAPSLGRLGGFDEASFRMNDVDEENLHRIAKSWKRAESKDIDYIFDLVLGKYIGLPIPEPEYSEIPTGVFVRDPITMKDYPDADSYRLEHGFGSKEGEVVLCFSGNSYPTSNIAGVRMLFEKLSEFSDVLPVAMNSYNIRYVPDMESLAGRPDAVVNVQPFRFMAGPMGGDSISAVGLLRKMDAPYISPFFMTKKSREEWEADDKGLNPMEFMLSVFLPELDGGLCTLPLGFMEERETLGKFGIAVTDVVPLEDRVDRIAGKVRGLLRLRKLKNSEKKVAIISYNYPPGEGNLFGGSFLNGAGSISSILDTLADAGYSTDRMTADEIINAFLGKGILNDGDWIRSADSLIHFRGTAEHPREVAETWGRAPGKEMTDRGEYLIPGLVDGNIFIGLQPPRVASGMDMGASYHDKSIPPHHQYLAFYEWIRDVFKADAVVHLGTHGTLEFLPGKENAVSSKCYPDMILGNIPHFYIYYAGNPSEAMIAKRRSHACIISYMQPPFRKSGIYGDLEHLESMIAEYRESIRSDPGRAETLLRRIRSKASEMRLPEDPEDLEDELMQIRESLIPCGLHTFGKALEREDAENYAANAMRFPHDGVPDPVAAFGSEKAAEKSYAEGTADTEDQHAVIDYRRSLAERAMHCEEREGLLKALNGEYCDVRPGGDSMKDPDVLPSGHSLIQFNPYHIPTMAAFERGVRAAEDMITQYRESTGSWPRSAALVLWGLETSRTQGMTIGQICGYLGLKMIRTSGEFASRFEVIPLEELGRPRVDVTISMCGFFRDMFPNLIEGLGKLFPMISSLDEPDDMNPIRCNTSSNRRYLCSKGYDDKEADELAECRLFGPAPGEYGTDLTDKVGSSQWKNEYELGASFAGSLRYAYTGRFHGKDVRGLLGENHRNVEIVSQVRDSTDRELIDLDHYYEFLGGLSKAVENASGKKAAVFVADGSGPSVKTQSAKRSIERGIRTRLLNPKWIDGLLEVRYHGAQKINDRFENLLGLAATVGGVDSGVFSDMLSCYVRDEELRRHVRENNNWAYMSMLKRLYEAYSRGYWKATEEELDLLAHAYGESEDIAEEESDIRRQ